MLGHQLVRCLTVTERLCTKVGCRRPAVATLTYDYSDSLVVVGPLGLTPDPHSYDLCALHADRLSVPQGWSVIRHASMRE